MPPARGLIQALGRRAMNIRNVLAFVLASGLLSCAAPPSSLPVAKPILPKTEGECVSHGGSWLLEVPDNFKYCLLKTTDGGKVCKASSECQSECVERETGNVCADYFSGCFQPTGRGTVTQCVN